PTYHFTRDGYHEDRFRSERLSRIKQLERNPAVLGQLLMWADFLSRSTRTLFAQEYPFIRFGKLETVDISTSLPDDIWYQFEDKEALNPADSPENQLRLLGL